MVFAAEEARRDRTVSDWAAWWQKKVVPAMQDLRSWRRMLNRKVRQHATIRKKAWLGSTNEKMHPALRAHARASYAPTSKFNFTSCSIMGVNVLGVMDRPEAAQFTAPDVFGALYMVGACIPDLSSA
ncbi:MAG: hypothetical protein Q9204_006667 [Flavoplaca sp. TL-2023a]